MKTGKASPTVTRNSPLLAMLVMVGVTCASSANAAVLAAFTLDNNTTASSVATGVTASSPGLTLTGSGVGGFSGLLPIQGTHSVFTFAGSLTDSTTPSTGVLDFSITPDVDQQITLDLSNSATWQFRAYDGTINATPYTVYTQLIVASDAAFTNILAQSSVFNATNNATGFDNGRWGPVTDADFDGTVTSSSTLYFRLLASDDQSGGDHQLRFDNIIINGSVSPIPEPSIALLGGLGLLGLLRRRR